MCAELLYWASISTSSNGNSEHRGSTELIQVKLLVQDSGHNTHPKLVIVITNSQQLEELGSLLTGERFRGANSWSFASGLWKAANSCIICPWVINIFVTLTRGSWKEAEFLSQSWAWTHSLMKTHYHPLMFSEKNFPSNPSPSWTMTHWYSILLQRPRTVTPTTHPAPACPLFSTLLPLCSLRQQILLPEFPLDTGPWLLLWKWIRSPLLWRKLTSLINTYL